MDLLMSVQLRAPCRSTKRARSSSSSLLHGPLIRSEDSIGEKALWLRGL
ncbi:hypothetical protein Hanom_Chr04g00380101 [Helianthus anomalus]